MVFCRLQESLIFIVFFCSFNCKKYGLKKKLQKLHNIKFFKMSSYEDYSACREIVQFVSQLIFKIKKVNLEILTLFLLMAQGTLSVFEGSVFMCSLLIKEDCYQIHPSFHWGIFLLRMLKACLVQLKRLANQQRARPHFWINLIFSVWWSLSDQRYEICTDHFNQER